MDESQFSQKDQKVERAILEAVRGLRFGSVEITVHNSHVIQLERREKTRFDPSTHSEFSI